MAGESYTLREVAELLGVSKRTLQRRIQEGAFPGRFLAPGRHGLETRVPAIEVQRVLEDLRRGSTYGGGGQEPQGRETRFPTVTPAREYGESLVPVAAGPSSREAGVAVSQSDLVSMRDAMLAIVREDRESFLAAVREALVTRDRELAAMRNQLHALQRVVERLREALDGTASRAQGQGMDLAGEEDVAGGLLKEGLDVDRLLREVEEIEALLGATPPPPS